MKVLTRNINYNSTPVDIYNQMKRVPGTSFQEVSRTLQAIKAVTKHPRLLREVIEASERLVKK